MKYIFSILFVSKTLFPTQGFQGFESGGAIGRRGAGWSGSQPSDGEKSGALKRKLGHGSASPPKQHFGKMSTPSVPNEDLEAQIAKMQQQQGILKRAVLQEQRRREEAEVARDALAAQVTELTELAAGRLATTRPAASPNSGWLSKGIGNWITSPTGTDRRREPAPPTGIRTSESLEAEVLAKAQENEALQIRMSELSTAYARDKAALEVLRQVASRLVTPRAICQS